MKVCIAQTRPVKGNIQKNIEDHIQWINLASLHEADIIIFPELSLTGYEPELAKALAINDDDQRLDVFQKISDLKNITIGVGIPTRMGMDILISMIVFQGQKPRQIYSKQYLHQDEYPYFVKGQKQILLNVNDAIIAPAICYESLVPEHSEKAHHMGADIYLASVAKPIRGVEKAIQYFPQIAGKYSMAILMANCVGYCDNFESVGKSSVWNQKGILLGQLSDREEGILIFNTETQEVIEATC